jgi:hypothetical protein
MLSLDKSYFGAGGRKTKKLCLFDTDSMKNLSATISHNNFNVRCLFNKEDRMITYDD